MTEHPERYWEARWRDEKAENDRLVVLLKTAHIDALLATQLRRAIENNGKLVTALRRIKSLDEKNVAKYAQQIAREALL